MLCGFMNGQGGFARSVHTLTPMQPNVVSLTFRQNAWSCMEMDKFGHPIQARGLNETRRLVHIPNLTFNKLIMKIM